MTPYCRRRRATSTIVLLASLGTALATAPSARSCGTFDAIPDGGSLRALMCISVDYYDESRHAPLLLDKIVEAIRSHTDVETAQQLFEKYQCLPTMKERAEYSEIVAAFGNLRCHPEAYFRASAADLVVVDVALAELRPSPSMDDAPNDRLRREEVLKVLAVRGDWRRVRTRWDNVGWVRASCLRPYEKATTARDSEASPENHP